MKRYIRVPKPRPLVALSGQPVAEQQVTKDGTVTQVPMIVGIEWFCARLLQDPIIAERGFEGMRLATEIMRAVRGPLDDVIELEDEPHWKLLSDIARKPRGPAAYDARFAETNYEFAKAIIGATLEDPRRAVTAAAE